MKARKRFKKNIIQHLSLDQKARRVLFVFLTLFLAIEARLWFLCIHSSEKVTQEVLKPRQKVFIEAPKRGGIYDRFGEPLAVNQVQYHIGVYYPPIRQIPSFKWKKEHSKKRIKHYVRRQYISELSELLARALHEDPKRIEDLIHSKASLLSDSPLILKENVGEKEYYRLKRLESQWPGLYCAKGVKRHYPQGKVACHILGYMGAINRPEYERLKREMTQLKKFLKDWQMGYFPPFPKDFKNLSEVRERLKELSKKKYSIYDWVGKAGIEGRYDELLRGYCGQKSYYADAKGDFIRPMATQQSSLSGNQVTLSISSELQKYAEELLIENEAIREGRSIKIDPTNGQYVYQKQPWLKGGAIAVMDPQTGEVLALASCPRFDPNDFISTQDKGEKDANALALYNWLETDKLIENLWDHKQGLTKEVYCNRERKIKDQQTYITLDFYLERILPDTSAVKAHLLSFEGLNEAIELQRAFEYVLSLSGQRNPWNLLKMLYPKDPHKPYPEGRLPRKAQQVIEANLSTHSELLAPYRKVLDTHLSALPSNYDKLLLVDLARLLVDSRRFTPELTPYIKFLSLSEHREFEGAYAQVKEALKKSTRSLFSEIHFSVWRQKHQKAFLKAKRKKEHEERAYPKPYLDYLDQEEQSQFECFWANHHEELIETFLSGSKQKNSPLEDYLQHFELLAQEMQSGAHQGCNWKKAYEKLSSLYQLWPSSVVVYYLRTLRTYQELDRPLLGHYRGVSPMQGATEKDLAKSFYPKHGYSYARSYAYQQSTPQGSLFKLVTAYESLRQNTHKPHSEEKELINPFSFVDDLHRDRENPKKWNVGFLKNGRPIPQIYKGGRLPRSHRKGIGHLEVTDALAISSNPYFALLASETLSSPNDLNRAAAQFSFGQRTGLDLPGEIKGFLPADLEINPTGLYSYAIGHHTLVVSPIQTCVMLCSLANGGLVLKPQLVQSVRGAHLKDGGHRLLTKQDFAYKKTLALLGIDFPLFLDQERGEKMHEKQISQEVKRQIEMPYSVQQTLFKGMQKTLLSPLGTAQPNRVKSYSSYHPVYQSYQNLKQQIIGKTSSAEVREIIDLDLYKGVNTYKHVWFGGIVFEEDLDTHFNKRPELVVVVYLRYGDFGREAAPLVSAIAQKWRRIKRKHANEEIQLKNETKEINTNL